MKVKALYQLIDEAAPFRYAMDFDNPGMLVGDPDQEITRVLLCVDMTEAVLKRARTLGANVIVSHHPLIFHPLKAIERGDYVADMVSGLIEGHISILCAHTNFDVARPGVNDALAERIGLREVCVMEPDKEKNADGETFGLGRIGVIDPCTPDQLAERVKAGLNISAVRMVTGRGPITRVAVSGGACGDYYPLVKRLGCDAFVTADIKHDQYLAAAHLGLTMIDAGHYATEYYGLYLLEQLMEKAGIRSDLMPFAEYPQVR